MLKTWTCLAMVSVFWSPQMTTLLAGEPSKHAAAAFEKLKGLVGRWEGLEPGVGKWVVTYKLIAKGSALVETWSPGSSAEAMTVYTIDGDDLIATHFCPWGNQPRLRLTASSTPHRYAFEIFDGANLNVDKAFHQVSFWLRVDGPDAFTRSETYVANGGPQGVTAKPDDEIAITYNRVALPD